jgi:phage FluMu protein gp41
MSADLFTLADERLVRIPSHSTSVEAAKSILPCRTVLQQQILTVLKVQGPMTAGELENLSCFRNYGFSTVRKRVSELKNDLRIAETGEVRKRMTVWRVA